MPNHSHSLENDTIIDGTYRVLDFLGEGGMGVVYKVEHTQLNKILALKIIKTSQLTDSVWQRFRNEAQAIARLDHRNVVKIYDMNQTENGRPYYTMDFLTGESLADYLKEHKILPLPQALHIFRQVCSGLAYAHSRGIIHRDIKPANIMLLTDPKNQQFQVKIVDFGIAKLVDDDGHTIQGLTRPGEVFGSPLYMSPEQCEGRKLDARSDMYSVAVTLFKSLTGNTPFRGRTAIETTMMHQSTAPPLLNSVSADLQYPEKLERIIDKMLSKSPEQRYQSLAEVENELQKLQIKIGQASPVVSSGDSLQEDDDEVEEEDLTETNTATVTSDQTVEHNRLNIKLTVIAVLAFTTIGFSIAMLFYLTRDLAMKKQQPVSAPAKIENPLAAINDMGNYATEAEGGVGQKRSRAASFLYDVQDQTPAIKSFLSKPFEFFSHKELLADGTFKKTFEFPQDFSVGMVIFSRRKDIPKDENTNFPAKGSLSVPAGTVVRFEPTDLIGDYPKLLSYFRSDDILALRIPRTASRSTALISNIARLQGLECLELTGCQLEAIDLKTLESLKNLRTLNLSGCNLSGETLASSALIPHLCYLNIEDVKGVSSIIKVLSPNLYGLVLNRCLLTTTDIEKVARQPELRALYLNGCQIVDADLRSLTATNSLVILDLQGCDNLTKDSLPAIQNIKSLRFLKLPEQLDSQEVHLVLHSRLPELKFELP